MPGKELNEKEASSRSEKKIRLADIMFLKNAMEVSTID